MLPFRDGFRYFEDYELGKEGTTAGWEYGSRTITEADFVNYVGISAEYSRAHADDFYMSRHWAGQRIAQGMMGPSLAAGMISLNYPHLIARSVPGAYFAGFESKYSKPIYPGDSITVNWRIADKSQESGCHGYGKIKTNWEVRNQENNPVFDGSFIIFARLTETSSAHLTLKPGTPRKIRQYAPDPDKYYCSDDFPVGGGTETEGRTITEADIVNFAGFSSDYNPQYVNADYAKNTVFEERIAHGLLVFNVVFGLFVRDWQYYRRHYKDFGAHIGDRGAFLVPVKIGDTIRCRYWTESMRVSKSRPDAGIITFGIQAINQRDEVVMDGNVFDLRSTRAWFEKNCEVPEPGYYDFIVKADNDRTSKIEHSMDV